MSQTAGQSTGWGQHEGPEPGLAREPGPSAAGGLETTWDCFVGLGSSAATASLRGSGFAWVIWDVDEAGER